MAQVDTIQEPWKLLTQASVNVKTLTDLTAHTAPYLAYGTTWATTSVPHSAQNPTNWPSNAITLPLQTNAILLCFLVADTNNDQVTGKLWTQNGNGAAFDLLTLNPIQSGTAICQTHPATGQTLRHFPFTSGGTTEIKAGDTITGATSTETAVVDRVDLTSGTWAAGDAAGNLYATSISGAFTATENINLSQVIFEFTSGSEEPAVGQKISGTTSSAVATLNNVVLESGHWSTGDAKGKFYVTLVSGTFQAENITYLSSTNIATILDPVLGNMAAVTTDVADFRYADTITISDNNTGDSINVETTANGMAIVGPIDVRGAKGLFFDWDTDLGSGTDGTDGICLWKEY